MNRNFATLIVCATVLALLPVGAAGAWAGTAGAVADVSVQKEMAYLEARQQADGGFAEPGQASTDMLTTWAVPAIKAAGEDPRRWTRSGKSPLDYLSARAPGWKQLTEIERGCFAASCAGVDPRSLGGRNLVAEIKARMAADGHIGDKLADHCWGVIALLAAGEALPDGSRKWLAARQNVDGGFGYADDGASDPDDTGATLQALAAMGDKGDSSVMSRALMYLHLCQASDGGFCWHSESSNVASTAWAVQGIAAAGQDPSSAAWSRDGKTPIDYLESMRQSDGHIRYMRSSDSQPAWMTAEAIPALLEKPFPLTEKAAAPTGKQDVKNKTTAPSASTGSTTSPGAPTDPEAAGTTAPGADTGSTSGTTSSSPAGPDAVAAGKSVARAGSSPSSIAPASADSSGHTLPTFLLICLAYLGLLGLAVLAVRVFLD